MISVTRQPYEYEKMHFRVGVGFMSTRCRLPNSRVKGVLVEYNRFVK